MRVSLALWVLALAAFCVATFADQPPWIAPLQWVAAGLALLVAGLLVDDVRL
jgi:predicted metal-binding membrane protein